MTLSNPTEFLTAALAHAEHHLARVRRIAAHMEAQLAVQGLSEIEIYEKLAQSKAHRQLQRDEVFFQQLWLRLHRHLSRLPQPQIVDTLADAKPQPYRKPPTPGCGTPLRPMPRAA